MDVFQLAASRQPGTPTKEYRLLLSDILLYIYVYVYVYALTVQIYSVLYQIRQSAQLTLPNPI